jgi:hypothetical protein
LGPEVQAAILSCIRKEIRRRLKLRGEQEASEPTEGYDDPDAESFLDFARSSGDAGDSEEETEREGSRFEDAMEEESELEDLEDLGELFEDADEM